MLLDSNAFVYWVSGSKPLAPSAAAAIRQAGTLFLSVASVWELEIKRGLGKFDLPIIWLSLLPERADVLSIELEDAILAGSLPQHHNDPFDRMIIAQAKRRGLPIVTRDRAFEDYGVPVIWA